MLARRFSPKYQTLFVAQNFELITHALSGVTIIFIPDKEPKYRTVRLNTGHLATLLCQPVSQIVGHHFSPWICENLY